MIPKIIHYCWFGRNPLPESAQKCIVSWRKYLPGYEIWQWSEKPLHDNENANNGHLYDKEMVFDENIIQYTKEAYAAKKYAFVSDYARFWILYRYGGLYFDTDVEVIKPMDDIIEKGPFMGIEVPSTNSNSPLVNPGLGIGATSQMEFYKTILNAYAIFHFLNTDGTLNLKTIVSYTTELLDANGMKPANNIQEVAGIWIYPVDYFNPFNDLTGKLNITDNTRSVHWYSKTWNRQNPLRQWLSRMSHRLFGMWLHRLRMTFK